MSGLFSFLVLGADRPSIDGLGDWIGNEVGTGIWFDSINCWYCTLGYW